MYRRCPCAAILSALLLTTPTLSLRHGRSIESAADSDASSKNPIRKVVTLLENMAKKVEREAADEEELYKKYACYCKTGTSDLTMTIAESSTKVPALQSDIETAESSEAKLKQDLKQHSTDRAAAKKAMTEATAIREKENEAYRKESSELKGYVDAISKAVSAIESGMSGTGFMQVNSAAAALKRAIAANTQVTDDDRQSVLSFLSGTSASDGGYVPKSNEVVGILKNMKESFDSDLAAVEQQETEAAKIFEELLSAKTKEVESLSASIEKKTARVGELGLEIVHMKNDLTSTEAALIEDQKFLKDLEGDCDGKKAEYDERVKTRSEELVAIRETINILSDDDALDLFKKTLPGSASSLLQVQAGYAGRAIKALRSHRSTPSRLDVRLLEYALAGRKVDFSKVIKMIDDMIALLAQEQASDESKVEYCKKQIDVTEDKAKTLARDASDLESDIEESHAAIAQLEEELKVLQAGVVELDKSVAEATDQRKRENEEFTEVMSSDSAAKELLNFARNRLYKFYAPKLHKADPPETADQSFLQREHNAHRSRDAPPPPPETWSAYQKKGQESQGVISMIDLLIRDLDKEMTAAEKQEELSQKAYEELMQDSASKRASDLKSIKIKEGSKADSEVLLNQRNGDLSATRKEFMAVEQYATQLHAECDWLLQNFDLRKTARAEESDNLKQAKAVLSGADFALLQKK